MYTSISSSSNSLEALATLVASTLLAMLGNSCFIPLNGAAAIRTMTTALQHLRVCLQFQLIH
jgi:hypothetical protein